MALEHWALGLPETAELANVIAAGSAVVSLGALVVAIRAQRANYALARKVADQAGRLESVFIELHHPADSPARRRGLNLVVRNGSAPLTLRRVHLRVVFRTGRDSLWPGGRATSIWLETPDDFAAFGADPVATPLRLEPWEVVSWRIPSRTDAPIGEHEVTYTFRAVVSSRDEPVDSAPFTMGSLPRPLPWSQRSHSNISGYDSLPDLVERGGLPADMVTWLVTDADPVTGSALIDAAKKTTAT
jgi:hypothetical protein